MLSLGVIDIKDDEEICEEELLTAMLELELITTSLEELETSPHLSSEVQSDISVSPEQEKNKKNKANDKSNFSENFARILHLHNNVLNLKIENYEVIFSQTIRAIAG